MGNADRIGDLDFELLGQASGNEIFGDIASRIGARAIDFGGVFSRECTAAVASHASVGVDDDLAPGQPSIGDRTALSESPLGLTKNFVFLSSSSLRDRLTDHHVEHAFLDLFV